MMHKNLKKALEDRENVTALKLTVKGKQLPDELFHFPNLRELYLEAPELSDFPNDVRAWNQLKLFQLKAPLFKGSLAPMFRLPQLNNLKTLETPLHPLKLALGGSGAPLKFLTLKDASLQELPLEFCELSTLEEIYLPGNELHSLPPLFYQLTKLKWLSLDGNAFKEFPSVLGRLPSLKHLSIDNNQFNEEEKERIQREFHLTVS